MTHSGSSEQQPKIPILSRLTQRFLGARATEANLVPHSPEELTLAEVHTHRAAKIIEDYFDTIDTAVAHDIGAEGPIAPRIAPLIREYGANFSSLTEVPADIRDFCSGGGWGIRYEIPDGSGLVFYNFSAQGSREVAIHQGEGTTSRIINIREHSAKNHAYFIEQRHGLDSTGITLYTAYNSGLGEGAALIRWHDTRDRRNPDLALVYGDPNEYGTCRLLDNQPIHVRLSTGPSAFGRYNAKTATVTWDRQEKRNYEPPINAAVDDVALRISTLSSGAHGIQPTEWAFPTHRNIYDDLHTASAGILLPRRTAHLTLPPLN